MSKAKELLSLVEGKVQFVVHHSEDSKQELGSFDKEVDAIKHASGLSGKSDDYQHGHYITKYVDDVPVEHIQPKDGKDWKSLKREKA